MFIFHWLYRIIEYKVIYIMTTAFFRTVNTIRKRFHQIWTKTTVVFSIAQKGNMWQCKFIISLNLSWIETKNIKNQLTITFTSVRVQYCMDGVDWIASIGIIGHLLITALFAFRITVRRLVLIVTSFNSNLTGLWCNVVDGWSNFNFRECLSRFWKITFFY